MTTDVCEELSELTTAPVSLTDLLRHRARATPDKPLFRCGEVRRTARQMERAVAEMARTLQEHGVTRGDRIVLMADNRPELLDLILACNWLGAVPVPINTAARGEQLQHILTNSQAWLLIAEEASIEHFGALEELGAVETVWVLGRSTPPPHRLGRPVLPMPATGTSVAEPVAVALDDPAAILYTSGTTGVSKGVICPQAQFYWSGRNVPGQLELGPDDVLFTCLPLFHTNALNAFSQALFVGSEYALGKRFSASRFWSQAAECGATFTYLLGAMASILMSREQDPNDRRHRVRAALTPAAPEAIVEPFRERFGVVLIDGYGSTETNAVISSSRTRQRAGYMGWLQEGFEARVVNDKGLPVAAGVPGELLLRSSQPFAFASGYYRMAEATADSWRDLWFHTGDRVVIETDGWIRFVDRIKDVIRRRGENISSVEVEQTISQHPSVADVAVYAVDSDLGEDEVMAALVPSNGGELDLTDLVDFCEPRLAYFAIPRYFLVCDALPLTENGKVRKALLREWGAAAATWDRGTVRRSGPGMA